MISCLHDLIIMILSRDIINEIPLTISPTGGSRLICGSIPMLKRMGVKTAEQSRSAGFVSGGGLSVYPQSSRRFRTEELFDSLLDVLELLHPSLQR
jgi:hypothetical protein